MQKFDFIQYFTKLNIKARVECVTVKQFFSRRTLFSCKFASVNGRENKVIAKIFNSKDYRTRYEE